MERIKSIKFDWTFNIGHIFSVIAFIGAAFSIWNTLDKRVVVLEVNDTNNVAVHKRIEKDVDELKKLQREDIQIINRKLDFIMERLGHR